MEPLTIALIIIFVALTVIPPLAKRINVPVIVLEIIAGIILGKSVLGLVPPHGAIDFFASFGLIYLLFLAGVEIDIAALREKLGPAVVIAFASLAVPFAAGILLSTAFSVHPLILGTILSTTSLGIVLPLAKEFKHRKRFSKLLLSSVTIVDIVSMFLLALTLTALDGSLGISFLYSALAVLALFLLPWLLSKSWFRSRLQKRAYFDTEVRLSFAIILGLAAVSEAFGFHSIIGAFIAGLIISEVTPDESHLEERLESFGYGFFIPLFFIIMGVNVDLPALFSDVAVLELLGVIVIVGILTKVLGAGLAAKLMGLTWQDSTAFGFFHAARLSLIIAAAEIARQQGLIDGTLFSMLVLLAVATSLLAPLLGKQFLATRSTRP